MLEQISRNFNMTEFSRSSTAQARGIDNTIPEGDKLAVWFLVNSLLQPLCDITGWRCKINSGYRSKELNAAVGGVETSQHRKGEAADCVFYGSSGNIAPIDVLRAVMASGLEFDQMIAYNSFVHLSYTTERWNRQQVLYNKSYTGPRL